METKDFTLHRDGVDGDFDVTVYGTAGRPVIAFPEGNGSCASWEDGGMVDALSQLIDDGRMRLFCVDSADGASWYAGYAPTDYRLASLGGYFELVENELIQLVRSEVPDAGLPIVVGAGLGALNATIAMLRRPDAYAGLLALSATHDASWVVGNAMSEGWRAFSPVDIVRALAGNASLAKGLSGSQLAFVCGTGGGEECAETQRTLEGELRAAGVEATFEYWGSDVDHSWGWWQEEARQLLPCLLEEGGLRLRRAASVVGDAQVAAQAAGSELAHAGEMVEQAKLHLDKAREGLAAAQQRSKAERDSVARHAKRAELLGAAAREAWAEKDRIAALLEEALRKGNEAQAQADRAEAELSSARWIAGEAEAAVAGAESAYVAAQEEVSRTQGALEAAQERDAQSKTKLQAALEKAEVEKPAAARKPAARKKPAETKRPSARKPSGTKAPAGAKRPSGTKAPAGDKKPSGTKAPASAEKPAKTPKAGGQTRARTGQTGGQKSR